MGRRRGDPWIQRLSVSRFVVNSGLQLSLCPNDFAGDIVARRTVSDINIDFALDLQHRLSENRTALVWRGSLYNGATITLLVTPLAALIASLLVH